MSTTPEASQPRWRMEVVPVEGLQGQVNFEVHAPDVTQGELALVLIRVAEMFARAPNTRVPTVAELRATIEQQRLAKEFPVVAMYAKRDRAPLFLSQSAIDAIGEKLRSDAWIELAVPEGASAVCALRVDQLLELVALAAETSPASQSTPEA